MSSKVLTCLKLFCCILVLVLSAKSKEKEANSGENDKNELDQINEVLLELNATVVKNKLHGDKMDVVHDHQIHQLLMDQNRSKEREDELKVEINHINQVLSELIGKANSSFAIKKPEICNCSLEQFYEHEKPDFTWVITNLHQKLNQTNFRVLSEEFPLRGYPLVAVANLQTLFEFLYIHLAYIKKNLSADSLPLETLPTLVFIFRNHSENYQTSDRVIRQVFHHFNATLRYNALIYGFWLITLEPHQNQALKWVPKYRVSDTVSIDIHVEPPQWSRQACSHDGTLTWVIKDYKKKLEMEKDLRMLYQFSPYFYTSPKGYRMMVSILLDGFEETRGKGLTVFVWLLNGPNDKTLNQSFDFRSTVTLLHPTDPTKHIAKSVDYRESILDMLPIVIDMGTHEEIERLLVDDTLYYNVTVVELQNVEI